MVSAMISNLDPHNAREPDAILEIIIEKSAPELASVLYKLYNVSVLPAFWKL